MIFKKSIIKITGVTLVLSVIISVGAYFAGMPKTVANSFHYFQAPDVKISKIKLEVVYFVPNDQKPDENFYTSIENAAKEIQNFHLEQFRGLSALRYAIYAKPVLGIESSAFYDGSNTAHGNPDAVKKIFLETASRVFNPNSDMYDAKFTRRQNDELPIRIFIYQGVGASSGVLSAIISYDYFTKTNYGATTLYHEILHNLGVPDGYDYIAGDAYSDDIMGGGRIKPISQTYIREEIKKQMME